MRLFSSLMRHKLHIVTHHLSYLSEHSTKPSSLVSQFLAPDAAVLPLWMRPKCGHDIRLSANGQRTEIRIDFQIGYSNGARFVSTGKDTPWTNIRSIQLVVKLCPCSMLSFLQLTSYLTNPSVRSGTKLRMVVFFPDFTCVDILDSTNQVVVQSFLME